MFVIQLYQPNQGTEPITGDLLITYVGKTVPFKFGDVDYGPAKIIDFELEEDGSGFYLMLEFSDPEEGVQDPQIIFKDHTLSVSAMRPHQGDTSS